MPLCTTSLTRMAPYLKCHELVRRFHKELKEHESRSAKEVEELKRINAAMDDGLGRHVESKVAC